MPRGDRTGPLGEGPLTGRQLGYGAGYDSPGYTKSPGGRLGRWFRGRGAGFGHGFGRGFFRWGWGQGDDPGHISRYPLPEQPEPIQNSSAIESLRSEIKDLRDNLNTVMKLLQSNSDKQQEK